MSEKPTLVFFGTGPVSLHTLEQISPAFSIEAIITKPSTTKSHKHQSQTVEDWAKIHKIPVHLPADKAELSGVFMQNKFKSLIGLVVDYGIIIPQDVLTSFKKGILNSHFSILPEWRGADPITFAILSGQKITGVSIMLVVPKLDEGDLLTTQEYRLPPTITIDVLTKELTELSSKLLIDTIPKYLADDIKPYPQPTTNKPTYSRKLTKQDGLVDCNKSAEQIEREIRAYLGWPKSLLKYQGLDLILLESKVSNDQVDTGKLNVIDSKLLLGCKNNSLQIIKLQIAGKKPMDAKSFINGYQNIIS